MEQTDGHNVQMQLSLMATSIALIIGYVGFGPNLGKDPKGLDSSWTAKHLNIGNIAKTLRRLPHGNLSASEQKP
jgi:hypothetical protein